jgi:hypothetical protein
MVIGPADRDVMKILLDLGMDGTVDDSTTVAGTPLGVENGAGHGGTPAAFALLRNYPNPFNPSTTVRYEVPERSYVTLKVFDVLGREVATLVDRVEEPGSKRVNWDAAELPGGVYYLRMAAEGFTSTGKMLLVR